jgi:hypothetical protein
MNLCFTFSVHLFLFTWTLSILFSFSQGSDNHLPRNLPWILDHIVTLFTATLKMETGYVSETLVCVYKTAQYCNTKYCNVKFFIGLTSAISVLWIDHSVDSTVGHVCNDMKLFVTCCKFLVTPQSCRVCRSGILYHVTNLSHTVLCHISWDTSVYISEVQSGCVEQNLVLCALQTLIKTKTYPPKTLSGLWMSLQGCFYYMYYML